MSKIKTATPTEVDAHAETLMAEFFSHVDEVRAKSEKTEELDDIFQGWAIQKIASLQLMVLELSRCVIEMDARE